MNTYFLKDRRIARPLQRLVTTVLLMGSWQLQAAVTDIANAPLVNSQTSAVKPNIMFILDNSGSMTSNYMPDDVPTNTGKYAIWASQCNGVAYNPATTYTPPVAVSGVAGSSLGNSSFNAAPISNYSSPQSTTNRTIQTGGRDFAVNSCANIAVGDSIRITHSANSANFMEGLVTSCSGTTLSVNVATTGGSGTFASWLITRDLNSNSAARYFTYSGTQTPLDYTFTGTNVNTATTFYRECNSNIGSTPGSGVFTEVILTNSSPAADKTNYANWFTYYRTRRMAMRAATGLAFADLDQNYRVGFSAISDRTVNEPATGTGTFLNVRNFDATQKGKFFADLYATEGGSNTPLRGALAKAGQYFANKVSGQTVDPMQYSCQRNFSILTTDGYWNTGTETTSYGPLMLDGSTSVGQQDGAELRPMKDSSHDQATTISTWSTTRVRITQAATPTTSYPNAQITTTGVYGGSGTSGTRNVAYTGFLVNNSIARCSNTTGSCLITVTTQSPHGLANGSSATILNATPTTYNGTRVITVTGPSTYTFTLASRPNSNSVPGNTLPTGSCASGSGSVTRTQTDTATYPLRLSSTTTADRTITTNYVWNQVTTVTPYTRTVIANDGVVASDVTTAGTPVATPSTPTPPPADVVVTPGFVVSGPTASNGTAAVVPTVTSAVVCSNTVAPTNTTYTPNTPPSYATTVTPTTRSSSTGTAVNTVVSDTTDPGTPVAAPTTHLAINGPSNTLADVAQYYWATDLRTPALNNCVSTDGVVVTDVCSNSTLHATPTNSQTQQHMVTYGMGLANGTLPYRSDYLAARNVAGTTYYGLLQGTLNWPDPIESSSGGDPQNIDDLWHASINGRGYYYSARDSRAMVGSLRSALSLINAVQGSGSAAATSALQLVSGTNSVFQALYTTLEWTGDIRSYPLQADGTILSTVNWSAQSMMDSTTTANSDTRTIYYFRPTTGVSGTLRAFNYTNLLADGLATNLANVCAASLLSQCTTLSAANVVLANSGDNFVNYLRGQTGYEALKNVAQPLFRERTHVLGDIVGSSPVYVPAPSFNYTDAGYVAFKTAPAQVNRTPMLYAGANDGMLHAFNAATGQEAWAFIPRTLLPNLYRLADTNYSDNHRYYVDGTAVVGDVYVPSLTAWRTILVGGLNAGGKVYYALDITDPANPIALWEFSNANLGNSFGNPVITKRANGTWVVAFGSGYNNTTGDGNGHLFVVNAYTGALVTSVPTNTSATTPAGTTTTPSGLAKINAWVESDTDNTAARFYGGDLLGNLWRFDIDSVVQPYGAAIRLAQLQTSPTTPQPITTRPVLAALTYSGATYPVVLVGTGQLLGGSDLTTTDTQSVYAIKDPLDNSPWGDVRTNPSFVQQTLTLASDRRSSTVVTTNPVDWRTRGGWFVDLPSSGERINVNMALQLNTLTAASNIPSADNVCAPAGTSWLYNFNLLTGGISLGSVVGTELGSFMVAGLGQVQLANQKIINIISTSTGTLRTTEGPTGGSILNKRRSSWRELSD